MDVYEATRIVLSRIQSLDPANASKIMGLLLLQDHGEKEMIRLAFGPQNLLHSVIAKAKKELGLMASDLGFGWGHCSYECHELLRSKSVPPRLAHHFPKGVNLQQSESQRAAALMMGDDLHKFGSWRPERTDLSAMACPASRQIYLTFPADSIFREEDVSNYFGTYGPVQDVRIPYQQKRMFGFVTFVYPDTVKSILAKGNPHFVCDSRVLVKPYKEKGKVPDKYRTKPSPDGTPTGLDIIMAFHENTQELLWRRRFEEQALEIQSTRLMNLQLHVKKHFQLGSPNPFDQTLLDNSPPAISVNREGSDEDTIKLAEWLPESPFASPTHHFLEFDESAAAEGTSGSGSASPCFDKDESTSKLAESYKCQMPSLSLIGMLPGRVGI
ncbi:unnamed protein product [Arabis nemorensis]|uniref:RRM domain-containing protein n=1 Tax=Arabis nemorensis TaxID=586526 RepID=A0A565BZB5_9BRAS|nr:unnamed protein product [Arabis nemorensis]